MSLQLALVALLAAVVVVAIASTVLLTRRLERAEAKLTGLASLRPQLDDLERRQKALYTRQAKLKSVYEKLRAQVRENITQIQTIQRG